MIASYDIVRNDGDFFRLVATLVFFCLTKGSEVTLPFLQLFSSVHFSYLRSLHWNYCVLDEGHIIKNGKTKVSGFEMVDIEDSHSTMETFKI